jgi:hypothetical protein
MENFTSEILMEEETKGRRNDLHLFLMMNRNEARDSVPEYKNFTS